MARHQIDHAMDTSRDFEFINGIVSSNTWSKSESFSGYEMRDEVLCYKAKSWAIVEVN